MKTKRIIFEGSVDLEEALESDHKIIAEAFYLGLNWMNKGKLCNRVVGKEIMVSFCPQDSSSFEESENLFEAEALLQEAVREIGTFDHTHPLIKRILCFLQKN